MLDVCSALCIGIRFNVDDRCSFAKRSEANQEFIIRRATREGKARAHTHAYTFSTDECFIVYEIYWFCSSNTMWLTMEILWWSTMHVTWNRTSKICEYLFLYAHLIFVCTSRRANGRWQQFKTWLNYKLYTFESHSHLHR